MCLIDGMRPRKKEMQVLILPIVVLRSTCSSPKANLIGISTTSPSGASLMSLSFVPNSNLLRQWTAESRGDFSFTWTCLDRRHVFPFLGLLSRLRPRLSFRCSGVICAQPIHCGTALRSTKPRASLFRGARTFLASRDILVLLVSPRPLLSL